MNNINRKPVALDIQDIGVDIELNDLDNMLEGGGNIVENTDLFEEDKIENKLFNYRKIIPREQEIEDYLAIWVENLKKEGYKAEIVKRMIEVRTVGDSIIVAIDTNAEFLKFENEKFVEINTKGSKITVNVNNDLIGMPHDEWGKNLINNLFIIARNMKSKGMFDKCRGFQRHSEERLLQYAKLNHSEHFPDITPEYVDEMEFGFKETTDYSKRILDSWLEGENENFMRNGIAIQQTTEIGKCKSYEIGSFFYETFNSSEKTEIVNMLKEKKRINVDEKFLEELKDEENYEFKVKAESFDKFVNRKCLKNYKIKTNLMKSFQLCEEKEVRKDFESKKKLGFADSIRCKKDLETIFGEGNDDYVLESNWCEIFHDNIKSNMKVNSRIINGEKITSDESLANCWGIFDKILKIKSARIMQRSALIKQSMAECGMKCLTKSPNIVGLEFARVYKPNLEEDDYCGIVYHGPVSKDNNKKCMTRSFYKIKSVNLKYFKKVGVGDWKRYNRSTNHSQCIEYKWKDEYYIIELNEMLAKNECEAWLNYSSIFASLYSYVENHMDFKVEEEKISCMARFLTLSNLTNSRVSEELWFWFRSICQIETVNIIHTEKLCKGIIDLIANECYVNGCIAQELMSKNIIEDMRLYMLLDQVFLKLKPIEKVLYSFPYFSKIPVSSGNNKDLKTYSTLGLMVKDTNISIDQQATFYMEDSENTYNRDIIDDDEINVMIDDDEI